MYGGALCFWYSVWCIAFDLPPGGRPKGGRFHKGLKSMATKKMTMGLIVGNRGFFPDHLAKSGREEMLRVLTAAGMDVVALTPEESKYGAVETREDSRRCAELFKRNRHRIAPGQFLRQDVGLQQFETVWYSVLDYDATHGESGFTGVRPRPALVRGSLPRGQRLSQSARGSDWCASNRFQHRPLQREDSRIAGYLD